MKRITCDNGGVNVMRYVLSGSYHLPCMDKNDAVFLYFHNSNCLALGNPSRVTFDLEAPRD